MSIESLKQQARKHEQNEDWNKALDQYNKALAELAREEQVDIGLYNRVGDLHVRVGNLDPAVEHYEKAVELYREAYLPNNAIAVCKKVIRNVPARHKAYLVIGQIRAEQGFIPDARTNFLTYAERMQKDGDLNESFRALIEFCDLAPDDVGVRITVAEQMAAQSMTSEAVEQFLIARQHYLQLGDNAQAEDLATRILNIDPEADLSAAAAGGGSSVGADDVMAGFGEFSLESSGFEDSPEQEISFSVGGAMEEAAADTSDAASDSGSGVEEDDGFATDLGEFSLESDDDAEAVESEGVEEDGSEEPGVGPEGESDEESEAVVDLPLMDMDDDAEEDASPLPMMDFDAGAVDSIELPTGDMAGDDGARDTAEDDDARDTDQDDDPSAEDDEGKDTAEDDEAVVDLPGFDIDEPVAEPSDATPSDDAVPLTDEPEDSVYAAVEESAEDAAGDAGDAGDVEEVPAGFEDEGAAPEDFTSDGEATSDDEWATADSAEVEASAADSDHGSDTATDETPTEVAEPSPPTDDGGFVDLGAMILGDLSEKSTRFTVAYEEPSGDEEADFAKMLSQFKDKVSENMDSSDVRAHYDLGTAYKEMGLLDEAIGSFQAALRAAADHLPTYEVMGQTFLEMGQPEAAVKSLERAVETAGTVEDELVGIYYYLGRAYEQLEDTRSAVEYYDRVFSLDINFADVTERLRELR
jgi:tetratricopeptide (TPR) repeat protein